MTSVSAAAPANRAARRRMLAAATVVGWACIGLALTVAANVVARPPSPVDGLDYRSYTAVATRFWAGAPLYPDLQLNGRYVLRDVAGVAFVYPPSALFALIPAAAVGLTGWRMVGIIFLALGLLAVLRRERRLSPLWIGGTLLGVTISEPFSQAVALGNVSNVVAGLFAFAYAGGWPAGAAGAALKVVPGFAAVVGGQRSAVRAIAGAAALVGLSVVLFGADSWRAFATAIGDAQPDCADFTSVACALLPLTPAATAIAVALGGLIAVSALFVGSRRVRLGLATVAFLCATPELLAGTHYLIVATPLLLVSASSIASLHARRRDRPSPAMKRSLAATSG